MSESKRPVDAAAHFVHRWFIWLLVGSYLLAGVFPGLGLAIKNTTIVRGQWGTSPIHFTLPMLLLALLLFNAALGVEIAAIGRIVRRPLMLLAGLAANWAVPILFIVGMSYLMRIWHNPDEVQNILMGLALVASMPIAGSSTAWSQNSNGNLALSLGLVLGSTLLSPIFTPMGLHAVGFLLTGDYAEDLHELAGDTGTELFLLMCVIVPSLAGILLRPVIGKARLAAARSPLKLANSFVLLTLNYSNASVSLPQTLAEHDWDFLAAVLSIALLLCCVAFGAGWLLSRALHTDFSERVSLMFGLGMNNNGTGLVFASMSLSDHPRVMLPIIFYNLVQHLVAGTVDHFYFARQKQNGAE